MLPDPVDFILVVVAVLVALGIRDFWKNRPDDEDDGLYDDADERQERAHTWAQDVYGFRVNEERYQCLRTFEEMCELIQAHGLTLEDANKVAAYVFAKKPGDPEEELGDVLLSLNIMAEVMLLSADELLDETLERVEDLDPEKCLAKDDAKIKAGLV